MLAFILAQMVLPSIDPEWFVLGGGIVALWVRLEHRLTRVETKLESLRKRNEEIDNYVG